MGGIDQSDVRERLREITYQLFGGGIVFLRQQSDVVAERQQPLKEPAGFFAAPLQDHGIGKPKTAGEKCPLTFARNSRLIAQHQSVPGQPAFDLPDG